MAIKKIVCKIKGHRIDQLRSTPSRLFVCERCGAVWLPPVKRVIVDSDETVITSPDGLNKIIRKGDNIQIIRSDS